MLGSLGLRLLDAHEALPLPALRLLLGRAVSGLNVALCLHRVRFSGPHDPPPDQLNIAAEELDHLLDLFTAAGPKDGRPWLAVTFDDGYADSLEYVRTRHARYPNVEWILFICPEKISRRAGFRWDLPEASADRDSRAQASLVDVERENRRPELQQLGDDPVYRLATLEECREVARLERVYLGNHTNGHFRQTALSPEAARREICGSARDFAELFGVARHFAFPFGTPGREYGDEHVALAREAGHSHIWSTEPRPYRTAERASDGVLPRFPIFGDWPATKMATFIAGYSLRYRLRRAFA